MITILELTELSKLGQRLTLMPVKAPFSGDKNNLKIKKRHLSPEFFLEFRTINLLKSDKSYDGNFRRIK